MVEGEVRGRKANSQHGFHVHEKGDCSSGDGMSADATGVARFKFEASGIMVGAAAADIVGKGLIVHRDPDDYITHPTGNAGPRLGCAVIAKR